MAKSAKAPDYEAAAVKQGESSMENTNYQTHANRPNQVTPWGQQTWKESSQVDPVTGKKVPSWTQTTTLSPDQQRALDAQTNLTAGRSEIGSGMLGRIQSEFDPIVDFNQFDKMGGSVKGGKFDGRLGGADAFMGKAGNALMSQFKSRMDPQFQQQSAQADTMLRNRGVKPGDEAYDAEMSKIRMGQGDQFNQAMFEAQKLSSGEASRMQGMDDASRVARNQAVGSQFGQDMTQSGYDTQRRQQQITELMSQRGLSLNEANALISGQQVAMPTMPGFNQANRSETTQYSQAAGQQYQADQDAANAQNAMTGQLLSAASAPFSMSDRRLKRDIKAIGKSAAGLVIYTFRYLWDKVGTVRTGHMADEVEKVFPDAVVSGPFGYKMVNYARVG